MTERRRTPLGTQPPAAAAVPPKEASGTIESKPPAVERPPIDPDQEHTIIVQIDDAWLERLDPPRD